MDKDLASKEESDELEVILISILSFKRNFNTEIDSFQTTGEDNARAANWFIPLDKAAAMLSQGYTDSMFSVYPEDLLNELIVFRSNLQKLLDYNGNRLPRIFSVVNKYNPDVQISIF